MSVRIVCLLDFDDGHKLSHGEARAVNMAIRTALQRLLPEQRIRGLWVHEPATTGDLLQSVERESRGLAYHKPKPRKARPL